MEHKCFKTFIKGLSAHIERHIIKARVTFKLILDKYDGAGDDVEAGQVRIGGHLGEERSPWATHSW